MIKQPTLEQKVKMYEQFIDKLALHAETGSNHVVRNLINNAVDYSYAHRAGNGEMPEDQQDQLIAAKFWKLLNIQ